MEELEKTQPQDENNRVDLSERYFWPRVSEVIDVTIEYISNEPEKLLTDDQKKTVLEFENSLFSGNYEDIVGLPFEKLPYKYDISKKIAPEYFLTEAGKVLLCDRLSIDHDLTFIDVDDVVSFLRSMPVEQWDDESKPLEDLSELSLDYVTNKYSEVAISGESGTDIELITIYKDLEHPIKKAEYLLGLRLFIREVREDLKQKMSDALPGDYTYEAQFSVTDIYRDKLSELMAELYPSLLSVFKQIACQPEEEIESLQLGERQLGAVKAVMSAVEENEELLFRFARRLDYVRNGASYDGSGLLTPLDPDLLPLIEEFDELHDRHTERDSVFSEEEVAAFKDLKFDKATMMEMLANYNQRVGYRDEGWTEEETSNKGLSVVSQRQKVKVPKNYNSTIAPTDNSAGVVGGVAHEEGINHPGHIWQTLNAARNPMSLAIGKHPRYRGKRYLGLREAGGMWSQDKTNEEFFGEYATPTGGYARAMQVLISGGGDTEAIRVFAESHLALFEDPSESEVQEVYKLAVDRVLRLRRYNGWNSQPLQYVEAVKVNGNLDELDKAQVDIILSEAVYDPVDMMRLHCYGMLPNTTEHFFRHKEDPQAVIVEMLRDYLKNHKHSAT